MSDIKYILLHTEGNRVEGVLTRRREQSGTNQVFYAPKGEFCNVHEIP